MDIKKLPAKKQWETPTVIIIGTDDIAGGQSPKYQEGTYFRNTASHIYIRPPFSPAPISIFDNYIS